MRADRHRRDGSGVSIGRNARAYRGADRAFKAVDMAIVGFALPETLEWWSDRKRPFVRRMGKTTLIWWECEPLPEALEPLETQTRAHIPGSDKSQSGESLRKNART